jgi:hypothetical protein
MENAHAAAAELAARVIAERLRHALGERAYA